MFRWQRYKLFLVSLHISSLFCCFVLCKDEFRVEILVKGNGCGERFALLAGETIERSGLALGEQVGDVGISEQLSCYLLEHWHTGSMTRRSRVLDEREPEAAAYLAPVELDKLGLAAGDAICIATRRGSITLTARADQTMPEGMVFVPFAFVEAAANVLTNPALDPFGKIPEFKYAACRLSPA